MLSILNLTKTNKLVLAAFAFVAVLAFGSGRAHAATLNVAGGCTLAIAINSINAGANQSGCTSTGAAYGTSDTINLPAGTQTLTADLPTITEPVVIQGAGMSQTTIDGDGAYFGINARDAVTIKDLKVTAFRASGIKTTSSSVVLDHIEVDGQDAIPNDNNIYGIWLLGPDAGGASTITADSVYIHNISATNNYIHGFIVDLAGSSGVGTMTVSLSNTTISDLHAAKVPGNGFIQAGVNAFMITAGLYGSTSGGSITSTVDNTTINDITAAETAAGFGTFANAGSGQTITMQTTVRNATVTGIYGSTSIYITKSPAFFAAGVASNGGISNITEQVENSLIADNNTDGTPSNCFSGDLSSNFGASGGTVNASIISNGHNISDDATCTTFTQSGDQQSISGIIPTLGPLQDNGGTVPTRALLPGSPAIAAGASVLGITTDARGVARPDDCPSVGAFQFEGAVCAASTTNAGTNAGAPNTGANPVSLVSSLLASFTGLLTLGYVFAHKRA